MKSEEVPQELKEILDAAAGKGHSATGSVMTALARILTLHERMVRDRFMREFAEVRERQGE